MNVDNNHRPVTKKIPENIAITQKRTFKNQLTGSLINVKNTGIDFPTIQKELSLLRIVKGNAMLKAVAGNSVDAGLNDRLGDVGMAVTTLANAIDAVGKAKIKSNEIVDKNPRGKSIDVKSDPAINKRGEGYIRQFPDAVNDVDATNYAIGLRVGSDIKENILDRGMIQQFNSTWNRRYEQTT